MLALLALSATPCGAQPAEAARPNEPVVHSADGVPATHRFWSAKHWFRANLTNDGGAYTMFPEPLVVQTRTDGLLVGSSTEVLVKGEAFTHPMQADFVLGVAGLHAEKIGIAQQTDRMVRFDFGRLQTRVARGMPFVYVDTDGADPTVTFTAPPQVFAQQGNVLGVRLGENRYGLFCPAGGRWSMTGQVFTCHQPRGRHYLSVAVLPSEQALPRFARHAFTFPVNTGVTWAFDERHSLVTTTFTVGMEQREGVRPAEGFLQALYPHQYSRLVEAKADAGQTYASARGPMRLLQGDRFTVRNVYRGMLPFVPLKADADVAEMRRLLASSATAPLFAGGDTYSRGKSLNRAAQLLPLASAVHDSAVTQMLGRALGEQMDRWRTPPQGSFVYDPHWHTLVGQPAAYGSDTQLNDHHFHYGYWIGAAAMLGLFDPQWLREPKHAAFVAELGRDIANVDAGDGRYPLLRHFDAYAGHSWASGQAPFGDGQNEESSSEAVNAWAALALFAAETGDRRLRDAAIWMYTLETDAAEEYWFDDGPVRTFPANFHRTAIANLFDGKADAATWFGNAPEFEHGIEFLPFSGASLYLGRDPAYARRNLAEVTASTGGRLRTGSTFWPDLMEMYEAFFDPRRALEQWRQTSFVFDGESKAHEFAWLSSLEAYGRVDGDITADCTFFAVFRGEDGKRTHIAFNAGDAPLPVRFSDGFAQQVPAHGMTVNERVVELQPHR